MANLKKEVKELFLESSENDKIAGNANLKDLPSPVKRYLKYALPPESPIISYARIRHGGLFRIHPSEKWSKIKAEEYFTTSTPSFLWYGKVSPLPFLWISARDKLFKGRGEMKIQLLSTFTLGDSKGREMDISSILRFLAEAPLMPTAMLPSKYLKWKSIDESSAKAIISLGDTSASAVFYFNEKGQITKVYSEERYLENKGNFINTPWGGYYGGYKEVEGVNVPTEFKVFWIIDGKEYIYITATIDEFEFNKPSIF